MASSTAVRLTLKFNFPQLKLNCGWSESYDLGFSDLSAARLGEANIQGFIKDRLFTLGIGPILVEALLVAYVQPLAPGAPPVRRATIALAIPPAPTALTPYNPRFLQLLDPFKFQADWGPTVLYVEANTDVNVTPHYRRTIWLAGLPDISDQTNALLPTDPIVLAAIQVFLNDIQGTGRNAGSSCNVQIRSIDASGANPVKACQAWDLINNRYQVNGHGFVPNQPIIAEGMRTVPGGTCPRGRYLVDKVIDADHISLQNSKTPTAPTRFGGFRAAIFTFSKVRSSTMQGFTKRNKGRPSFLSVGRRRKPATNPA